MKHYDILIAGGGTAGAIAAIQAGRLGASVLLIEMTGQLGGTMTNGQVSGAAYFWSPLKQIIAGIGWELVQKAVALGSTPPPDYTKRNPLRPSYHTGINRFCLKYNLSDKATLAYETVKTVLFDLMRPVRPITLRLTHAELSGETALDFMSENLNESPLTDGPILQALRANVKGIIEEPTSRGFRIKVLL